MKLRFQDQDFFWKFLLADVAFPILGVDFLRFHKLLIDPEGHALLDSTGGAGCSPVRCSRTSSRANTTRPGIAGAASSPPHTSGPASTGPASAGPASTGPVLPPLHTAGSASKLGSRQDGEAYSRLLEEFPALVCASKRLLTVSHYMVHHIITHEPPITSKFRKLDGEKLAAANAEFKQLEEDDIIQRSTSKGSWPS